MPTINVQITPQTFDALSKPYPGHEDKDAAHQVCLRIAALIEAAARNAIRTAEMEKTMDKVKEYMPAIAATVEYIPEPAPQLELPFETDPAERAALLDEIPAEPANELEPSENPVNA